MLSVSIGGKDMYTEFGFILSHKEISYPQPKINEIEIPNRDGVVDFTNVLSNDIKYKNRQIKMDFILKDDRIGGMWSYYVNKVATYIHGKKHKIIFFDDASVYYFGRLKIDNWNTSKRMAKLSLVADCEPWKYDLFSSVEEWEWDSFSFEDGIINDLSNITVNGTAKVVIFSKEMRMYPVFTASSNMSIIFNEKTYQIEEGTNKLYDLDFAYGKNEITVTGQGTLTINYRGGSL